MRRRACQVAVALVALVALALAAAPALGDETGLTLVGPDGSGRLAPAQSTEVVVTVRGPVARARVVQRFRNDGPGWVEGIYVFPLPPRAAVDTLRMRVGDRVLEGVLRERESARRVYERAREEGRRATLVEQERPNVFTTSVANIGPGDEVEVELEMQWLLPWRGGRWELRFPTVVGVRYIPGRPAARPASGTGTVPDTDAVPDASRVTPAVAPAAVGPVNPFSFVLDADVGLPLAAVKSPTHRLRTRRGEGTAVRAELVEPDWANRDVVVELVPRRGQEPGATVLAETFEGDRYVLLMVMPPAPETTAAELLPREVIVVLDTSGSMHGTSIAQAKRAVRLALARLRPQDEFDIVAFASRARALWPESRPAIPSNVEAAERWLERLEADGGTEMLPALRLALGLPRHGDLLRQVVFVTDGCVGNEAELLGWIERGLGDARLFTVGIGSAPNGYLMERAAAAGRGTYTYVPSIAEVGERMGELLAKLEAPVLADLEVRWPDPDAEMWPGRLGDLYAGEPLVAVARLGTDHGEAVVSGVRADAPWEATVPLGIARPFGGIHRLWARRKIAALERERIRGADPDEVRRKVVAVSLRHGVLSRYTALVAVDVTPARPDGEGLERRPVPVNLPAGWSRAHVLGRLARTGTGFRLEGLLALLLLAAGLAARRA